MRGTLRDEERLDDLEDAIDRLREEAEVGTVVVEGARDIAALDWLGIGGLHVTLHRGMPMAELFEELVQCPPPVILLVDWDRTGGRLLEKLEAGLAHRVQVDLQCRRRLATAARNRTLEAIPGENWPPCGGPCMATGHRRSASCSPPGKHRAEVVKRGALQH